MNHAVCSRAEIEVYALASGSSGNATLIRARGTNILLDSGLGIRKLSSILHGKGVLADNLHAILITHEHVDHVSSLGALSRRTGAPVFANAKTLEACMDRDPLVQNTRELPMCGQISVGEVDIRSFPVMHDAAEPAGYVINCGNWQMTYFTDAGCVTQEIREALVGSQLAVVEANHDLEWLKRGPYTQEMKRRVASNTGHLSNADCADLLAAHLDQYGDMTIWLAHLSNVNNSPSLARRTVFDGIRRQTKAPFTIDIALRDSPSAEYISGNRAVQLSLF